MRAYEAVYILSPELGEEAITALNQKLQTLIRENDGIVDVVEEWGRRRLAYEIEDHKEGYYVLLRFRSEPDFPRELERVFKLSDGLLRFLVVTAPEEEAVEPEEPETVEVSEES